MTQTYNQCRALFCALLLIAFVVQGLIPAGFMPGQAANGQMSLEICSGIDMKTVYVGLDQVPSSSDHMPTDQENHQSLCAFAPVLSASLPGSAVLVPLVDFGRVFLASVVPLFSNTFLTKTWLSRGPPVS